MKSDFAKYDIVQQHIAKLKLLNSRFKPNAMQLKLLKAVEEKKKKRILIHPGRKAGKTEGVDYIAVRIACLYDNQIVNYVCPLQKQARKIVWRPRRIHKLIDPKLKPEYRESELLVRFPNGSYVQIEGSDNEESDRGTEADVVILDEAKDINPIYYDACYPNLLARNGLLIVCGTPPDTEDNWYAKLYEEVKNDPDWEIITGSAWENEFLPNGTEWLTKEREKYYRRGDKLQWEREYEGKFAYGGKQFIFAPFNEEHHEFPLEVLLSEIERDKKRMIFGWAADPATSTFAVIFFAYNPYTSDFYILDEIYETEQIYTSTRKIMQRVLAKEKELFFGRDDIFRIYDEAESWFATEVWDNYQIPLMPTQKNSTNMRDQISLMKDTMSEGRYHQSDRCHMTKMEIKSYRTDDKGKLIDKLNHAIDCIRYILHAIQYSVQTKPFDAEKKRKMKHYGDYEEEDQEFTKEYTAPQDYQILEEFMYE